MRPTDFSISTSPLPEWMRLFLVAAMLDFLRRISQTALEHVNQVCWITISFEDDDTCYNWILHWLSKHPSWHEARSVQVTTRTFGVPLQAVTTPEQVTREGAARTLSYMPSTQAKHTMWFKGYYAVIRRECQQPDEYSRRESIHISILTRNNSIVDQLLAEAKQFYVDAQNDAVSIYVQDNRSWTPRAWRQVASRPKRPLKSIILERGIKEKLLNDARRFLGSAEWYAERGIPFRRGYLLYGAPGSGKTSVIQSLAGELGLDVYVLTLNRAGLDDSTLCQLVAELPRRCIALIEDIDAAFFQSVSRRTPGGDDSGHNEGVVSLGKGGDKRDAAQCRVSLSGLLNALDGIASQDGRILFATTNHYAALDPALTRPGRMDLHIEFKLADKDQAEELFFRFFIPSGEENEDGGGNLCGDDGNTDIGVIYLPPSPPLTPTSTEKLVAEDTPHTATENAENQRIRLRGMAKQFARAVPDRQLSMAGLQGYLMLYKDHPVDAVRNVAAWVEQEIGGNTFALRLYE
ncbi:P-loop containing nucleoside triphosphate hydrolase protein [Daedalea quercina L-15889]|uniref:p-loop containing nucleoside triphosphate hydrolase protein n=1 Tax=Daedalea quercina L-15889 TaxID=1314783 RepID=A0A165QE48_9APHY|nr:P-loop containing nucleoside triphosphate hydrolase protein [Daedalea quercina L-15889]